jgi:hypothetical protein
MSMPSAPPAVEEVLRLATSVEEELLGPRHAEAVRRIRGLGARLGEALDWAAEHDPERGLAVAAALWRYWAVSDALDEGRQQLGWLLALVPAPSSTRLRGLVSSALLASYRGEHPKAAAAAQEAMPLARALDDEVGLGYLELVCSRGAHASGHERRAAAHTEQALEHFRGARHPLGAAIALLELARLKRLGGRPEEAARLLGESQLLEAGGLALGPEERLLAQSEEVELRRLLGPRYEAEWQRGRAPVEPTGAI